MILFVLAQLNERALKATESAASGRVVLRVPIEATWRLSDWPKTSIGNRCGLVKDVSREAALAAMVAAEAPGSDLYEYASTVPLVDVPRTWDDKALELLPAPWLERAKEQRKADSRAYRRVLRACSLYAPRRETFAWALGVVANSKHADMLVPKVDALAWSTDPNVQCVRNDSVFECRATRFVDKGEALTVADNRTDPFDFLFTSGFVPRPAQLPCPSLHDPETARSALRPQIQHVRREIDKGDHLQSRVDMVVNALVHQKSCVLNRLGGAADDDMGSAEEL